MNININEIKNSTLAKLTCEEAQTLWLANCGFGFYKGELKTRYNGMKRVSDDGITFTFLGEKFNIEFTRLADTEMKHWAARVYNKDQGKYETYPMGITGCGFIRG